MPGSTLSKITSYPWACVHGTRDTVVFDLVSGAGLLKQAPVFRVNRRAEVAWPPPEVRPGLDVGLCAGPPRREPDRGRSLGWRLVRST